MFLLAALTRWQTDPYSPSKIWRNTLIFHLNRATLFNLAVGLNGYTVSSGIISKELNGENIIARPLLVDEYMKIGVIKQKQLPLSRYGTSYLNALKQHVSQ